MNLDLAGEAVWCRAATLGERAAVLRTRREPPGLAERPEAVEARGRWRTVAWLQDESHLRVFLESHGLDEPSFRALLGLREEEIARGLSGRSDWLSALQRAFRSDTLAGLDPIPRILAEPGFLKMVRPLLGEALTRLRDGLRSMARSPGTFDPDVVEDALCRQLPSLLGQVVLQTFTLELHVARLEGALEGDTPRARYESFVRRLDEPRVVWAILREYRCSRGRSSSGRRPAASRPGARPTLLFRRSELRVGSSRATLRGRW